MGKGESRKKCNLKINVNETIKKKRQMIYLHSANFPVLFCFLIAAANERQESGSNDARKDIRRSFNQSYLDRYAHQWSYFHYRHLFWHRCDARIGNAASQSQLVGALSLTSLFFVVCFLSPLLQSPSSCDCFGCA